jgi:hypothetical protein
VVGDPAGDGRERVIVGGQLLQFARNDVDAVGFEKLGVIFVEPNDELVLLVGQIVNLPQRAEIFRRHHCL